MTTSSPAWPPEGTRVRILSGRYQGELAVLMYPSVISPKVWVANVVFHVLTVLVQRHEIEVIENS